MSRISQFGTQAWRLSVLTVAMLTVAMLLWAAPSAVQAAGYVYQKHAINAGVVFVGSAGDLAVLPTPVPSPPPVVVGDPAPYLFYVLNNRPDARPTDLTLVNPQAPQTVTPSLARRWGYAQGAPVTPSMAGYWEVPLHDISSGELQQYDVLYLNASGYSFSPADNEKLRRFVDSGGQLFIEYGSASGSPGLFTGTSGAIVAGTPTLTLPQISGTPPIFLRHPLLSQPYLLSPTEISSLATFNGTVSYGSNDGVNLFGPVLLNGTSSNAVVAGQLGAGQIIASALNLGGIIGAGNVGAAAGVGDNRNYLASGAPPTPANFSGVPAADLKFLSNLISWSETHPSEYKTSHGNASAGGLSAFSTSWLYAPQNKTGTPPGAAVWGNFVFAVDAGGFLHGFNAYPGSNLTGPPGGPELPTTYPAQPYDEIWPASISVGPNASAPTVATHNGVTYVFVEKANGSIVSYDAVTGGAGLTLTNPATTPTSYSGGANAPAPTYYDGRLYAGQADGTLSIYDLNDGKAANIPLDPTPPAGGGESVLSPPSVGLVPNGDTNVIVAIVPTNYNIYTVLLGARNEPLIRFNSGGVLTGYSIDHNGRYRLTNSIIADTAAVPLPVPYYSNGTVLGVAANNTNPQDPLFTLTDYNSIFTDWNTDFAQTTQNNQSINLNFISANTTSSQSSGTPLAGAFSAPAIDRRGDYYYTLTAGTNSYLIGVKNAPLINSVQLKFRFRLPTATDAATYKDPTSDNSWKYTDADGVDYSKYLLGYHFVGAPVVDDQGNVYAAAVIGGSATVLCFKGNQGASADTTHLVDTTPPTIAVDLTAANIQQPDEVLTGQMNAIAAGNSGNGGTVTTTGQYTPGTDPITFYNFASPPSVPLTPITGNLTEPQPVVAVSNGTDAPGFPMTALLLHTNLSWYAAPFPTGNITGLSKVGNSLFLTDGDTLYSLPASPVIGAGKLASITPSKTPLGLNGVSAPPSVGGSVMVVNGQNGIGVLTRQVTVVTDSHRVLGVDGDGAAIWSVDATTRTDANGGVTKVPFSHPVSLSQFADNEYLVADTGNNRCVRFDSGGNVQWELTRFSDTTGLMAPGQPDTLSQPTSIEPRTYPDTDPANPNGSFSSYLIADSGNDRIVEVTDRADKNGNVFANYNHILTWVTHTADQYGRRYRYGSATYFPSASGLSIAATVTNTRIGALVGTTAPYILSPASNDAPGGCLVVFNRPTAVLTYKDPTRVNDLVFVTSSFYTASGAVGSPVYSATPYTVRNPRFLSLYTPTTAPTAGVPPYSFLYADDNGAFDLSYDTNKGTYVAEPTSLQMLNDTTGAGAAGSYQSMTIPINAQGVAAVPPATPPGPYTDQPFIRTAIPFVPTSVQRFGADGNGFPHYLITQTYAQGEVGGRPGSNYNTLNTVTGPTAYVPPGLGGEVFEAYYDNVTASSTYQKFVGRGTYAGHTLSRPTLTGPLIQPTFALRVP